MRSAQALVFLLWVPWLNDFGVQNEFGLVLKLISFIVVLLLYLILDRVLYDLKKIFTE